MGDALRPIWPSSSGGSSVFLGIASAVGRPHIQHRGGPPGFLNVLDELAI
jgi:hypothetical protein